MDPARTLPVNVFVVSDVRFYREGLGHVLASTKDIVVLGTAPATAEALTLAGQLDPDVVLVDTAMVDGVWMAQQFAAAMPATKIIALAVPQAEEELIVLVEAGVLGYVTREQSLDEVTAAISSVVREEMVCSSKLRSLVAKRLQTLAADFRPPAHSRLTAREREILGLIAQGLSNKQIAGELRIEQSTVKNHVHNILDKLQVQTRMAAVAEMRLGSGSLRATGRSFVPTLRATRSIAEGSARLWAGVILSVVQATTSLQSIEIPL
jgi:two-component system, NarL family, nitrate/nitrite response regulator NarL